MVTSCRRRVVWGCTQSCAEKGKNYSRLTGQKSSKSTEINVHAIKRGGKQTFTNMQPFQAHFQRGRKAEKWKDHG
jgi:hypothetical protein